jgi:hypothetical protein
MEELNKVLEEMGMDKNVAESTKKDEEKKTEEGKDDDK